MGEQQQEKQARRIQELDVEAPVLAPTQIQQFQPMPDLAQFRAMLQQQPDLVQRLSPAVRSTPAMGDRVAIVALICGACTLSALGVALIAAFNSPSAQVTRQQEINAAIAIEAARRKVNVTCISFNCGGVEKLAEQQSAQPVSLEGEAVHLSSSAQGSAVVSVPNGAARFRQDPNGVVLAELPDQTAVTLLRRGPTWAKVQLSNGQVGYIHQSLVR